MAFINDQNVPTRRSQNSFSVGLVGSFVDACDYSVVLKIRIVIRAGCPPSEVQAKPGELRGDVSDKPRRGQVKNPESRLLLKHFSHNKARFYRFSKTNFVCDQSSRQSRRVNDVS